jgi:hypothetical protein
MDFGDLIFQEFAGLTVPERQIADVRLLVSDPFVQLPDFDPLKTQQGRQQSRYNPVYKLHVLSTIKC